MNTQLKSLTPNLMVKDVNRTIAYYQDVLGFTLNLTVPDDGQFTWASMRCGAVELMFQATASLAEEIPVLRGQAIGGSLSFYIQMTGVEELYARLRDSAVLVQDLHTTFYGAREFAIQDCNGYVLAFAEMAE